MGRRYGPVVDFIFIANDFKNSHNVFLCFSFVGFSSCQVSSKLFIERKVLRKFKMVLKTIANYWNLCHCMKRGSQHKTVYTHLIHLPLSYKLLFLVCFHIPIVKIFYRTSSALAQLPDTTELATPGKDILR